jgi:hypothetical protein
VLSWSRLGTHVFDGTDHCSEHPTARTEERAVRRTATARTKTATMARTTSVRRAIDVDGSRREATAETVETRASLGPQPGNRDVEIAEIMAAVFLVASFPSAVTTLAQTTPRNPTCLSHHS